MGKSKGQSHNHMYITSKEYADHYGGKVEGEKRSIFKKLPFSCCALSLTQFEAPVCTENGIVYDIVNIVPFLRKHHKDPITGEPLEAKDLIKLHFHKNVDGDYICPITFDIFTDHSHIVAVRTSGNVYSFDAVQEMNIKKKWWKDLIDDSPFTKKDIITIQDPNRLDNRNIANFKYVKEGLDSKEDQTAVDSTKDIVLNESTSKIFNELREKGIISKPAPIISTTSSSSIPSSQSVQAPSFTSTGFSMTSLKPPHPTDAPGKMTKKKGYVRLQTSLGDLNMEINCDMVPKTAENFLELCERGYYNNTVFHRSIPNFMIQGGDPTGTGSGGQSIWDRSFKDECKPNLLHDARGVASMANAGANTNKSQFFILYQPARHLDGKHTVFGRVVGGLEVLKSMEAVTVNANDRPIPDIKLIKANVFVNPFRTLQEERDQEDMKKQARQKKIDNKYDDTDRGSWYSNPGPAPSSDSNAVGKYLPTTTTSKKRPLETDDRSGRNISSFGKSL